MGLLRAVFRTVFCTLLLAGSLLVTAPAQAASDQPRPGPGSGLPNLGLPGLTFGLVDPVIGVLPAQPVPHTPYAGQTCPDGAPECIEETIERMRSDLDRYAASCHHNAIFALAYLRVTEDVRDAVEEGHFSDRVWLGRLDAVFARDYFAALGAWERGDRAEVPKAWRIALAAADDKKMSGLGNFLLAMNAHINRDFSHALAEVGLVDANGGSHKADHNAYNARLDGLYAPVFAEEAARFDPTFDAVDVSDIEETAAGVIMRGWRELVWRHAEMLVQAKTPAQRGMVETYIDEYAATQAQLIRATFIADPARRDAWCAEHGRG